VNLDHQIVLNAETRPFTEGETDLCNLVLLKYYYAMDASFREKSWANERLGWLFTSQAIMIAAYGLSYQNTLSPTPVALIFLRITIPIVGILISLSVAIAVICAAYMHHVWTERLRSAANRYNELMKFPDNEGPLAFGTTNSWPAIWARIAMAAIPIFFICGWVPIIIVTRF